MITDVYYNGGGTLDLIAVGGDLITFNANAGIDPVTGEEDDPIDVITTTGSRKADGSGGSVEHGHGTHVAGIATATAESELVLDSMTIRGDGSGTLNTHSDTNTTFRNVQIRFYPTAQIDAGGDLELTGSQIGEPGMPVNTNLAALNTDINQSNLEGDLTLRASGVGTMDQSQVGGNWFSWVTDQQSSISNSFIIFDYGVDVNASSPTILNCEVTSNGGDVNVTSTAIDGEARVEATTVNSGGNLVLNALGEKAGVRSKGSLYNTFGDVIHSAPKDVGVGGDTTIYGANASFIGNVININRLNVDINNEISCEATKRYRAVNGNGPSGTATVCTEIGRCSGFCDGIITQR